MHEVSLNSIVAERRSQPHQLVEVLQDVQEQWGYISAEAMNIVAQELGVPLIEVYRVANFYKAFSLKPRGKNVLTVCTGTACHVRGAGLLLDQVQGQLKIKPGDTTPDGLFTLERVNCLGACAQGPIVVENQEYHHHVNAGQLRKRIKGLRRRQDKEKEND
jgi:NADH:ubiquinone oxidoreductase subunit E